MKISKYVRMLAVVLAVVLMAGCGNSAASTGTGGTASDGKVFPDGNLKIIFGYAAGGGVDVSFRLIQPYLEAELGVPIEIVYREGASGQVSWQLLADSEADGTTLGIYASPMLEFSILKQNPSYTMDSFDFLGTYTYEPQVMLTGLNETRWSNVQELIEYAKAHPGEVTFSVNGTMNDAYLGLKLIEEAAGVEFNIIPYEGGGAARKDLVGGHVDACETQLYSAQSVWDQTKMLALVWDENNYPDDCTAPLFNEATGLDLPNLGQSTGFIVPAGVKENYPERYEKLCTAIENAMNNPDYIAALKDAGQFGKATYFNAEETKTQMTESMELLNQYAYLYE